MVPAFREKLFQGGQFAEKFQVLAKAAQGRHFALYFRDDRLQKAFVKRGLSGDLSETDHDYLGVFTQNTNSSKADYWQHRVLESDVTLAADGIAEVALTVTVQNPSPPWVHNAVPDPSPGPQVRLLHPLGRQRRSGLPAAGRRGAGPGHDPGAAVPPDRAVGAGPPVLLPQGDPRAR